MGNPQPVLAAKAEVRDGSRQLSCSPPCYHSPEATALDAVPWDEVQRVHDRWTGLDNWRRAAELGRAIEEREEQESFERTGIRMPKREGVYAPLVVDTG